MTTATTDAPQETSTPPQFDLSSAVPETDDGKAVSAMPAFDIKSAVPEESLENARPQDNAPEEEMMPLRQQADEQMKENIEKTPPSPLSEAVRGFIENVGKGGLEQYKEADYAYTHPNETPEQAETELNKAEVAKGVMGQLQDTFNMGIMLAAPEMSPKAWATLGTFMLADTTRQAAQRIFLPNLTPSTKDVLDILSFPAEGGLAHGGITAIGDMISKAFTIKGVSPTFDVSPDFLKLFAEPQTIERPAPFVKTSQIGWPAPDVETPTGTMSGGVLEKLGITENHANVSINTDLPVRIPLVNLFNLEPDEAKQIAMFESEGGGQQQGTEPKEGEQGQKPLSPLHEEAKKYKTAEEFIQSQQPTTVNLTSAKLSKDYMGGHEAPMAEDINAPIWDLTGKHTGKTLYPEDIYGHDARRLYSSGSEHDNEAMSILHSVKGRPNAKITIYRAIPKDLKEGINPGDWITLTRGYAKEHGESNLGDNFKIVKKDVFARDIFTDANSIQEFGYDPQERLAPKDTPYELLSKAYKEGKTDKHSQYQNELTSIWNEANKQGEENANQRGEGAQGGSSQEGVEGQAQAGVHLRDTSQGGMETKAGEEVVAPAKEGEGERGTSKIAQSINAKAVEDKLTTGFKDLAGYEKINVKEQAEKATKVISDDIDNARAIIRGEKPLPDGLRGISLITAMEEHLKTNPDADMAYELANSPLVTETSHAAQELRLAAERTPDSATAKLAEVKKAMIDAKGGDQKVGKLRQGIAKAAKAEMDKINLSKEELSLDKFLKDIEC